jgi:hypothetical protein
MEQCKLQWLAYFVKKINRHIFRQESEETHSKEIYIYCYKLSILVLSYHLVLKVTFLVLAYKVQIYYETVSDKTFFVAFRFPHRATPVKIISNRRDVSSIAVLGSVLKRRARTATPRRRRSGGGTWRGRRSAMRAGFTSNFTASTDRLTWGKTPFRQGNWFGDLRKRRKWCKEKLPKMENELSLQTVETRLDV